MNVMDVVMLLITYLQKYVFQVNVKVFNKITKGNEAKTLVKHTSCDCKCKFDSTTSNSDHKNGIKNQKWNNGKCQCECKNYHMCTKHYH